MKKIISYSLWGNEEMYLVGAVKNAELAKTIYPDWICRYYVDKDINSSVKDQLRNLGAEVIEMNRTSDWDGLFWRFNACSDPDVEVVISRDCDSRLNLREKAAVDEWLKSDKNFHIMKDHPHHSSDSPEKKIFAGMWGVKTHILRNMNQLVNNFINTQYKSGLKIIDQLFLGRVIYPIIANDYIHHDGFYNYPNSKPFPTKRDGYRFVGEIFYADETPAPHWQDIKNIIG